jgi:uncharacterized protein YueI
MAKVDILIKKYEGQISPRTINALNNGDTTKTKKYLEYMCKMWLKVRRAPQVIKPVMDFDNLLPYIENKDIYHSDYSDVNFLHKTVENAKELKEEKTFIKEEHVNVLIENEDYILLIPKTHRGSLKYGKGTQWCTAQTDYAGHFNSHKRNGYLVYLLRKKERGDIWDKVAFYIEGNNVTLGEMDVYTSNDSNKGSRDIYKSSWDITQMMYIVSYVRQYVTYCEYKKTAKDEVKNISEILNKIDIDKLKFYKTILSDKDSAMFDDIDNRIKKITEKLSMIDV